MSRHAIIAIVLLSLICCSVDPASAAEPTEKERIDAAVLRVEKSDLTFIRNGAEHNGKDAADHLRLKLRNAGSAVKTFDDFVEKVATKSSISGKPYEVKLKDGTKVELAKWIREKPAEKPATSPNDAGRLL
jgi:hypothetical protein